MDKPEPPSSDDVAANQSFVISMYSVTYSDGCQPSATADIRSIVSHFRVSSPTKAASVEHVKRTTHQAGYVWGQSIIAKLVLPSPNLYGWAKSETGWVPFWTALPRAAKTMIVLISCGRCCTGRCSCYKKGFVCTAR